MDNLITVTRLSETLGVSRVTIYKYLNKLDKRRYTKKIKGIIHITSDGQKIISQMVDDPTIEYELQKILEQDIPPDEKEIQEVFNNVSGEERIEQQKENLKALKEIEAQQDLDIVLIEQLEVRIQDKDQEIDYLKELIREKETKIQDKDNQINKLSNDISKYLDQQQQLQLQTQRQIEQLNKEIDQVKLSEHKNITYLSEIEVTETKDKLIEQLQQELDQEKNKTFIQRLKDLFK